MALFLPTWSLNPEILRLDEGKDMAMTEIHNLGLRKTCSLNALINAHKKKGLPYNIAELAELSEKQMVTMRQQITGVKYLRGRHV